MFADLKEAKDWSVKNIVPIFLGELAHAILNRPLKIVADTLKLSILSRKTRHSECLVGMGRRLQYI